VLWILIVAATALRLVLAASLGVGNDEAYHYLFAVHPDASDFDHPPMLALVESVGLALHGFHASALALRLGTVLLFAGSTWLMARITARLYGVTAGWLAAFALSVTGYYGVAAATFALPDGPLVFFWLLTLERLLAALEEPERLGPWVGAGLAWGGAMLSKYQAVFLPLATAVYLVLEPRARPNLRRPGPYVALGVGVGVVGFAPVIGWNAAHGWGLFVFQGGRGLGRPGFRPDRFAAFLAGQAGYLFPWIWIPLVRVLYRETRAVVERQAADPADRFLLCQALVPLLAFGAVALGQPVLPHWSLVGFLAAFPLLGKAWARRMVARAGRDGVRIAVLAALPVVLAAIVLLHARTGFLQQGGRAGIGLIPAKSDPTADFYGWDQVARALEQRGLLNQPNAFLFSDRWYVCGHLAFAIDRRRPVVCYNRRHAQNFTYWSRPEDWVGHDGLFVGVNDCTLVALDLARWFRRFEPLAEIPVVRNGVPIRVIHLYRGVSQVAPFPFGNDPKAQAAGPSRK
jgi:4-amino-4-deoxy-L-arabinose transferase-like glycosyltransferase